MLHKNKLVILVSFLLLFWLIYSYPFSSYYLSRVDQDYSSSLKVLQEEQDILEAEIQDLRDRIEDSHQVAVGKDNLSRDLSEELEFLQKELGLRKVQGPGLIIHLRDGKEGKLETIIHDSDVRDLVNTLWVAGAETISINGQRLTHVSSIQCLGNTLMVNEVRISSPYEIFVLGNSQKIIDLISHPNFLTNLKTRIAEKKIFLAWEEKEILEIPAYKGDLKIRFSFL